MSRVPASRPARIRRILLALAVAAPVTPLAVLATSPAALADVRPGYRAADEPLLRTVSFNYTGQEAAFTVPAAVSELMVAATGAPGGIFDAARANVLTSNGRAARVTGTIPVTAGQVLRVRVGGAGQVPASIFGGSGGWNGGGKGGSAGSQIGTRGGAGGGGATDLRTCAAGAVGCDPLGSRLVVAAGGGGSGAIYCGNCANSVGPVLGGNAGAAGAGYNGIRGAVTGGGPGTAAAGGAGGTAEATFDRIADGVAGGFGAGADGPSGEGNFSSGGGGGGWYGGGSGGNNSYYGGGGGGGSSLVPAGGSSEVVARNVAAGLSITYTAGELEEVSVSISDVPMIATGADTRLVTATATTDTGLPYPGLDLSFSSSDPGQSFDTVVDHGDGTYTATLAGSTTAGNATITATAAGSVPSADVSGTTSVVTEGFDVSVSVDDDTPMVATGQDEREVTATATTVESDRPVPGLDVAFASTDPGQSFGAVTDNGDGTYSATLAGSTTADIATVTATAAQGDVAGTTAVVTEGYTVTVRPMSSRLVATGQASVDVTAEARTASGRPLPGLDLRLTSTDPGQTVGAVTDHGDGTYSARLTGSTTPGAASLSAVVTDAGTPAVVPATLQTDPYAAPTLTASLTSAVPPRHGWYRTPVKVSFACAGTLFTAACPDAVLLTTEGAAQTVHRSIADSLARTASVTAGPISIDRTKPTVKILGARKGKTYPRPRKLTCRATDALSGVASCKVSTTKRKNKRGTRITWRAVASDNAGNTGTTSGRYLIRPRRR
jgi:hypothetical protein